MTCLVVMQPTVLPWSGYFNLMANSDIFIFHDDVQLEKRSWQTRNKLLFSGKESWVTIPIKHSGEHQKIIDTQLLIDRKWRLLMLQKFKRNYEKHPYFFDGLEAFEKCISSQAISLASMNEEFIRFMVDKLEIKTKIFNASELKIPGVRSERLINFCHFFQVDKYLSPVGSRDYLELDDFIGKTKVRLEFQDFQPAAYPQVGSANFISHLSIIDVLCNLGYAGTRSYIAV